MTKVSKQKFVQLILVVSDILSIIIAFFIAYYLRNKGPLRIFLAEVQPVNVYLVAIPFAVLLLLIIFNIKGLYKPKQRLTYLGELYLVIQSVTLWILLIMSGSYLVKYDYSRIIVIMIWFFTLILIFSSRFLVGKLQIYWAKKGKGISNIIIIGSGKPAKTIYEQLKRYKNLGFKIIGFVGENGETLGNIDKLYEIIEKFDIDQVYFADPNLSYGKILSLINSCPKTDVEFKVTANIFSLVNEISNLYNLEEIPSLDLKKTKPNLFYIIVKRLFDFFTSLILLLITLPLWIVIAFLIKTDSPGKIIFKQKRVGKENISFMINKFRTMHQNTDKYKQAPLNSKDDRVTKIGKFLRKTSLDELPQLLNILKGEMSFVGPRPEMPFIVEHYQDWQKKRLCVKPGLTGLWQILGRKDIPLHENLEYDFYYVNNQCILLDITIILKTIPQILFGKGAY